MRIWIDIANSPHVVIFLPIIKKLKSNDHEIFITFRNFAETIPLAKKFKLEGVIIGHHGGKNLIWKFFNLVHRVIALYRYTNGKKIDIALSHNSYSQIIAGKLIKTKVITMMDYEGQPANHLAFRLANKIIIPQSFPDEALKKFGAKPVKLYKYHNFKEQIYLSDFIPNDSDLQEIIEMSNLRNPEDIDKTIIITIRPPATMAVYHRFENPLFDYLLDYLNEKENVLLILFPRTKAQQEHIKDKYPNIIIPRNAVDGKNMIYYSDVVISAGGTMNRESAVLGTPTYSIFAGKICAVDNELINMNRMYLLKNKSDIENIKLRKKTRSDILSNPKLLQDIVSEILN